MYPMSNVINKGRKMSEITAMKVHLAIFSKQKIVYLTYG